MTAILNVTGAVTPEFLGALNQNFEGIDARLDRVSAPWEIKTADFVAVVGGQYNCDTAAGPFTATLPPSLAEGDTFTFGDFTGSWGTNLLLVDPSGNEFVDLGDGSDPAEPLKCNISAKFDLVFANGKLRVR
jgi:hypothetical protein